MILSWLSRFCATLLVPILLVATIGFTLSQTVLQGQYIKNELQKVDGYHKLSDGIVQEAAKDSVFSGLPTSLVQSQLKTVITPAVVQAKVITTIDQFTAYYNNKGPAPTFDISDITTQAQAAGLPAPTDPRLRQPIAIPVATKVKQAQDVLHKGLIIAGLGTAILIITMFAIAFTRRNFKPIAHLLIALGISVLVTGLGLYLIPDAVNKIIKVGAGNNSFVTVGSDLSSSIARDIGKRLLITGAIYEVIGIGSRLVLGKLSKPESVPELFRDDRLTLRPPAQPINTRPPTPGPRPPSRKIQL